MSRRPESATARDDGSALVEFLGAALLLLVPVVYLVLVLGQLQAAAFAVDGAAREAARVFVTADDAGTGAELATVAVALALDDQGLDPAAAASALTIACSAGCAAPGESVTATIRIEVGLLGVPGWLRDVVPLSVPVDATATSTIDTFAPWS